MSNTKTVYRHDSEGYYIGTSLAQYVGDDLLLPSDCVEVQPTIKNGYWSKWSGSKWTNEKIPTTCDEAIKKNLTCVSNGQGRHNYEVKALLESMVAADLENYRITVSKDFVMSIKAIPEKTLDELKADKLSELASITSHFDNQLVNTGMIIKSSLGFSINADLRSQNNLRGLIAVGVEPVNFIDATNSVQSLTLEQLKVLLNECALNGQALYFQKWGYKAKIENAQTKEDLGAIELKFTMKDFS